MATTKKELVEKPAAKPNEAAPAGKMTKTQLFRTMAEKLETSPKDIGAFFDLLVETAAAQTQASGEFTIPGLGKLVRAGAQGTYRTQSRHW